MAEVAGVRVDLSRVRVAGRVGLRLRGARVDLSEGVFSGPITLHGLQTPIEGVDESAIAWGAGAGAEGRTPAVRVTSLRETDAERLTLTDVDLSECRFAGMQHLDKLTMDGRCAFAVDPLGKRQVLAEEHYWRHARGGRRAQRWMAAADGKVLDPARLEVLYRQLRKALEDGKNEPGAADFYYGEMQMRRARATRWPDRLLLTAYWASSGYALRAGRALGTLLTVMILVTAALALIGFQTPGPAPRARGTLSGPDGRAQPINLTLPRQDTGPTGWSDRVDKATVATLNAVFVRPPATGLTLPGRYIEVVARILGPLLLGLFLLSVRNRVKR
ncbi:hypothetical protein [Actinomadura napierensis]|uniref:Pentapeptide repeat-containing protein n=1 Tax=Actinomadura napierensis TaxID=267854 RepID=A0ABP5LKH4_9ACTN